MEVNPETTGTTCRYCTQRIPEDTRFCPHCGEYQEVQEHVNVFNSFELRAVLIYYFITLLVCLLVNLDDVVSDVYGLFVADAVMAVATITFTIINWKGFKGLLSLRRVRPLIVLLCIPAAIIAALGVNIMVEALNRSLFDQDFYFYHMYESLPYAKTIMILSIAVYPAIFEELAFRGFMYNYLNKLFDDRMTMLITAFLFALLHLSFLAFFWLFALGWVFAWLRNRYNTLWYGMVIHFFFNLTAVFYELWELDVIK